MDSSKNIWDSLPIMVQLFHNAMFLVQLEVARRLRIPDPTVEW